MNQRAPNFREVRSDIRQRMLRLRANLPHEDRLRSNTAIQKAVLETWKDAWKLVLIYVNTAEEAATIPIILECLGKGRRLCVPVFDRAVRRYHASELKNFEEDLQTGYYGILEPKPSALRPVPTEELDAIFLPGLAFDRAGNRLGHGRGYFDDICRGTRAYKTGLAYQFQIVDEIASHEKDVPMHRIITDRGVVLCPRR